MEIFEKAAEIIKNIPRQYYLPIGIGCIGLILFVYGAGIAVSHVGSRENSSNSDFSQPQITQNPTKNTSRTSIKVDVEGAVVNPGVYTLPTDARIQNALIVAGGLSSQADRAWVEQHVNLALKVIDGSKIYIPRIGEVASAGSSIDTTVLGTSSNQQIDINSASESDLDSLPGIGPATVSKIISGRPYGSIQELVDKKVVGQKEFDKIKDLIVVQ